LIMWTKIIFSLMGLLISGEALANEKVDIAKENSFLEAELKLAAGPNIYLVFDLKQNKISIRARGMSLRDLPIGNFDMWGDRLDGKPYKLAVKTALLKPSRKKIKPGESKKEGNFEIEALELQDMPSAYTLTLDRGLSIMVKSRPSGILSFLYNGGHTFQRGISYPLRSVWNSLRKKPFSAVDIVLEKEAAQALYWSFAEGNRCVLNPP
jgi:hypothetical protein